jgi:hypothetical protein
MSRDEDREDGSNEEPRKTYLAVDLRPTSTS